MSPPERPTGDPASEDGLNTVRRLGCSFRLLTFFPSPERPPSVYPIEILPPRGFHFDDGLHSIVLPTWWHVTDRLAGARIVPCTEECER